MIGMLALALAMGIGRFAFTPLLPLMVQDGLLPVSDGAWLADSNYLGYLIGALWVTVLRVSPVRLMQISLIGIVLATLCMSAGQTLFVWLVLRFIAGVLSAWALVATSSWALGLLARAERPVLLGFVYAGVGLGIAGAGTLCLIAAAAGFRSQNIWIQLGILAALLAAAAITLLGRDAPPAEARVAAQRGRPLPKGSGLLIVCYGISGFGYVLPATFLPAIARTVVADPMRFGIAWPLFGAAAIASTLLVAFALPRTNRLILWSRCNLLMAVGAALPVIWPTLLGISVAALMVGGTFLIVTMAGLQEARARAPDAPTALLGAMTSAFAAGQILGPALSAALVYLPVGPPLDMSLEIAAGSLVVSALLLKVSARST